MISIGNYKENILYDIVPMEFGYILLGRPWQYDKQVIPNVLANKISFTYKGQKIVLCHLSP